MTKAEIFNRMLEVEQAGTKLLAAMDRQHGNSPFSTNVLLARDELRALFPVPRDVRDEARRVA